MNEVVTSALKKIKLCFLCKKIPMVGSHAARRVEVQRLMKQKSHGPAIHSVMPVSGESVSKEPPHTSYADCHGCVLNFFNRIVQLYHPEGQQPLAVTDVQSSHTPRACLLNALHTVRESDKNSTHYNSSSPAHRKLLTTDRTQITGTWRSRSQEQAHPTA